ncbi:MAG: type II secretion system F family protein [Nocardioidaceae bacterium]
MTAFMLAGGCVAGALFFLYRLAVPPRTDLVAAVGRWDQARTRASRVQHLSAVAADTPTAKVVRWLTEQVAHRSRNLSPLTQDLAITEGTLENYLTKALTLALAGLAAPIALLALLDAAGLGLPLAFGPMIGLGLAAAMLVVVRRELHETARKRRAELRRSLSIYLDLVAMSMQAGRGHFEALPAAAAIGSGWAFTQLQDAIDGARFSGITPWGALGQLGERIGMRELTDLDGALSLANDDGAKVRATLVARAGTLRGQRIADAEASAVQATESMKFALIVMVFVFLSYELYPSIARLFAG